MNRLTRVPLNVCLGLAIAVILDTAVQILWKAAVMRVPSDAGCWQMVSFLVQQPLVWLVVVLFLTQLGNWVKVLKHADLSYAQPITSLSYISVGVLSATFLHEHMTVLQYFGIALILAGVWFISRSEHSTVAEAQE